MPLLPCQLSNLHLLFSCILFACPWLYYKPVIYISRNYTFRLTTTIELGNNTKLIAVHLVPVDSWLFVGCWSVGMLHSVSSPHLHSQPSETVTYNVPLHSHADEPPTQSPIAQSHPYTAHTHIPTIIHTEPCCYSMQCLFMCGDVKWRTKAWSDYLLFLSRSTAFCHWVQMFSLPYTWQFSFYTLIYSHLVSAAATCRWTCLS